MSIRGFHDAVDTYNQDESCYQVEQPTRQMAQMHQSQCQFLCESMVDYHLSDILKKVIIFFKI